MDQFLQKMDAVFNSGDPELRKWFLVRGHYLPFVLCGFYAIFSTVVGPAIMKNRKPFDLRKLMVFFNFAIVTTYTICFAIILWYLPNITREEFCKGGRMRKNDYTYTLAICAYVIYLIKYVELFDTVFFILRKKEKLVTFLHVFHHTIVPVIGWTLMRTETAGVQAIPVLLNTFVHIVMYSYYGLAAMGPQVRKYLWWKKYLTQLQMLQFILIILILTVVAPYFDCAVVHLSNFLYIILAPLFLYLFYHYYKTAFRPMQASKLSKNGSLEHKSKEQLVEKNGTKNGIMMTNGKSKKEE